MSLQLFSEIIIGKKFMMFHDTLSPTGGSDLICW